MYLHPFSLLTYLVHEQRAPSFVLTQFLGVYKGKLAFDVASRQNDHRPAILDLGSIAERQTAGTSEFTESTQRFVSFALLPFGSDESQVTQILKHAVSDDEKEKKVKTELHFPVAAKFV